VALAAVSATTVSEENPQASLEYTKNTESMQRQILEGF